MIRQVSRILFKPSDKLVIKLVVNLLDAYSLYESNTYDYLTMNPSGRIVIQYKTPNGVPWDISQVIYINIRNIYYWNKRIQSFYSKIQNPDLYTYYKSGNIEYNGDESMKFPIQLDVNQIIEFEPGLISDGRDGVIPGIFMRINISSQQVELSFNDFEAMMYLFSQINIGSEAMQLIIAQQLLLKEVESSKKFTNQDVVNKPKVSIFQNKIEDAEIEEIIIDNRVPITKNITSLDDL